MQFDKFPILLVRHTLICPLEALDYSRQRDNKMPRLYTLHNLQPVEGNSNAPQRYNSLHKLLHTPMVIHTHIYQQV